MAIFSNSSDSDQTVQAVRLQLKRDGVNSKQQANTTHFDVGRKVRQTIQELGGTMPEELPTPQVSIKQLENSVKITEKK